MINNINLNGYGILKETRNGMFGKVETVEVVRAVDFEVYHDGYIIFITAYRRLTDKSKLEGNCFNFIFINLNHKIEKENKMISEVYEQLRATEKTNETLIKAFKKKGTDSWEIK